MESKRRNTVERRKRRTNHPHNCLLSIKLFFHRFSEIKTIKITVGLLFDCSGPKWNGMVKKGHWYQTREQKTVEAINFDVHIFHKVQRRPHYGIDNTH